ncbi:MAG: ABC transporter permease [Rhodospirillales bacterium]|nr:ABC transporter permease [Rhodospirillales bacterium]
MIARLRLILRLARRGGGHGLAGAGGAGLMLAALALGVGGIAAILVLRAAIDQGLAVQGRSLLGGDLSVESTAPIPRDVTDFAIRQGARAAPLVLMGAMLDGPGRHLVAAKAVGATWPLLGQVQVRIGGVTRALDAAGVAALLAPRHGRYGLIADPALIARMGLAVGAKLRLGHAPLTLRAALVSEPDALANPALFGPRVLISTDALAASGLILPGSILHGALRLLAPPGQAGRLAAALQARFPDAGLAIRTPQQASPALSRLIRRVGRFLQLAALSALLVGGIGVVLGVHAYLAARARGLAVLRCLGAGSATVLALCLIQILGIAFAGIALGLAGGLALARIAAAALASVFGPGVVAIGLAGALAPLGQAGLYGLLAALAGGLWPVGRAMRISGAALFRDAGLPMAARPPGWILAAILVLVLLLGTLVVRDAAAPGLALGVLLGAAGLLGLLAGLGYLVQRGAARLARPRAAFLRLGLAALHRPGGGTAMLTLAALGLGLSALATVALTEAGLQRELAVTLPRDAPSHFFIDLQPDQVARFRALAADHGARDIRVVPSLRARIVAVRGVAVDKLHAAPDSRWALRGDRGLTYAASPPAGTRLTAGAWWAPSYRGPPLLSLDANLARGWGVGVGDTVRLNILGRTIDFRIANLRAIAWRRIGLNFAMIASPGLLSGAPHGAIATAIVPPDRAASLLAALGTALPNVTAIGVAAVMASVAGMVGQLALVLSAAGGLTLASGMLVLFGALAAERRLRVREAVILKTLGASAGTIRAAWAVEFAVLGVIAGLVGVAVGTAASAVILRRVLGLSWHFLPGPMALVLAGALAGMLILGYLGTAMALREKAGPWLRRGT